MFFIVYGFTIEYVYNADSLKMDLHPTFLHHFKAEIKMRSAVCEHT